jgi:hypothetical protein
MTQYQLLQGYSSNQTLVVLANPSIGNISITGPSSPQQAGTALACTFTYLNSGGDGTTVFTLKDQLGATLSSGTFTTPAGSGQATLNFTMPSQDTTLTLTSNWGGSATRLIQKLLQVNTTLTLAFSPSSVAPGDTVNASGYLSRQDNSQNYSGISGVTVQLLTSAGSLVASGTTTSTGGYSIPFTAPSTAGSYVYKVYFAGSGILSASLAEGTLNTGVGADLTPLLWLFIGGVALYFATDGGKKSPF